MAVRRGPEQALDEYLILLAQGGDREAFGRLAARWTPKLLTFAMRNTGSKEAASDAVQETWLGALRGLRRLEDPSRFRTWIFAIAARKCADTLRAKYKGERIIAAELDRTARQAAPDLTGDPDTRLDLAAALERLPKEQRIAVSLLYGEDMNVAEIAAVTGAPVGTVKSRLSAARHALRAYIEGENDE